MSYLRGVLAALLFASALLLGAAAASAAELQVGAASAVVTPKPGIYLAGYGRDRKTEGHHDDVFAKAVVLADGDRAIAIVAIDSIGLLYADVARIRRRAVSLLKDGLLTPERIIVTSTHTHAGPDVVGLWGGHIFSSGRDEDYIDFLVDTAARQIVKAVSERVPAQMTVGSASATFSWVENVSEPGLLDNVVSVARFADEAGRSIATLTNFPCHPTVLGPDNHLVSSDYIGGFYATMDQRSGGVNLFLQGAIGGWVKPKQGDSSFMRAHHYGELLALMSERLLAESEPVRAPAIEFASTTFDIPLENFGFQLLSFLGVLDRDIFDGHIRTEVAWFSIGGVQFATHPGETSPAYSLATRALMGEPRHSFVLGLGLDALGYILKPDYFEETDTYPHADYLISVSVGPEAAPKLMNALASIIPEE